jgi:hypothetical protein
MPLRAIQPDDNPLRNLGGLVAMPEGHPALEIVEIRRHRSLDCFPSSFRGFDVSGRARASVEIVQTQLNDCVRHALSNSRKRYSGQQSVGRSHGIRHEVWMRCQKLAENCRSLIPAQEV